MFIFQKSILLTLSLILTGVTSLACVNVHPGPPGTLPPAAPSRTLTVTESATVPVIPDHAQVTVQMAIKKTSEAEARDALHLAIKTLSSTLGRLEVAPKDIVFQAAGVSEVWKRDPVTGQPIADGFEAKKTTRITLRNLSGLGESMRAIMDVSAAVGTVSDVTLGTDDIKRFQVLARTEASARLMEKARQLSKGTDARLGPIMNLSESAQRPTSVISKEVLYAQATTLDSLKLETTLTLQATFGFDS